MNQISGVGGIDANLAPDAFHRWATHYLKCRTDFVSPHKFSPVPYFLLCRAIEMEIKSKHLRSRRQHEVKTDFSHDLCKAYHSLDAQNKILGDDEVAILGRANDIYAMKGFEYFDPEDALTGYKRYPDLRSLDLVAKKLIGV